MVEKDSLPNWRQFFVWKFLNAYPNNVKRGTELHCIIKRIGDNAQDNCGKLAALKSHSKEHTDTHTHRFLALLERLRR